MIFLNIKIDVNILIRNFYLRYINITNISNSKYFWKHKYAPKLLRPCVPSSGMQRARAAFHSDNTKTPVHPVIWNPTGEALGSPHPSGTPSSLLYIYIKKKWVKIWVVVLHLRVNLVGKKKTDVTLRWHSDKEGNLASGSHGLTKLLLIPFV